MQSRHRPWAAALGLLALGALLAGAAAQAPEDLVTVLPDLDDDQWRNLTFFAGYLDTQQQQVYYNYFEAEVPDPTKAPLLVWQQGGPGCSPVGIGAFREGVGPFAFTQYDGPALRNITDVRLVRSPASWTAFANLLFLDTPAATGFTAAAAAGTPDDASSTAATLAALQAFYAKFPGAQKLRLFLAGQGYAGHTVPLLAKAILDANAKAAGAAARIPLQGIAVGNPWVDPEADNKGMVAGLYTRGVASAATYTGLVSKCDLKRTALWRTEGPSNVTGACERFRNAALREAFAVDLYGITAPKCALQQPYNVSALTPAQLLPPEGDGAGPRYAEPAEVQPDWRRSPSGLPAPSYDPCAAWRAWAYLNRDDVQEAINAIKPGDAAKDWQACGAATEQYSLASVLTSAVPLYKELANSDVRVLVYSGTSDAVFTTGGTRAWVGTLGLAQGEPFYAWRDPTLLNETSGFVESWKAPNNNTFHVVAVLEAGHNAASFKPSKMRQLMRAFVNDNLKALK